jgi:5-methylcytosine-specific restriction endonuclease McrA
MPCYLHGRQRRELKIRLCESQNWHCCYCGVIVSNEKEDINKPHHATFDHVVPMALHIKNAKTDRDKRFLRRGQWKHKKFWNYEVLVIACFRCNSVRKSIDAEDFYYGQMWKEENKLVRKLWQMKTFFREHGNIGILNAMGDYCQCEKEAA